MIKRIFCIVPVAQQWIEGNYSEEFDISNVEWEHGMSCRSFDRLFKKQQVIHHCHIYNARKWKRAKKQLETECRNLFPDRV